MIWETLKKNFGTKEDRLLFCKAVGYRLFGTLATIIISFIFTGSVNISLSIGFFEVLSKIFLYYFYEKIWQYFARRKDEKTL